MRQKSRPSHARPGNREFNRLRAAPIFSQSVECEAKKKSARKLGMRLCFRLPRPQFSRALFFFASRSTDCEKIGAARSLGV